MVCLVRQNTNNCDTTSRLESDFYRPDYIAQNLAMWPLAGTVLLVGGVLPSALVWLSAADGTSLSWQTAAAHIATDAVFSVAAVALLIVSVKYGKTR